VTGPELHVLVPGSIATLTGGYGYDREIVAALERRGWTVRVHEIPGTFPFPSAASRADAARVLASLPDGARVLLDGLALGALPDEAAREAGRLALMALVHHPLADETGLAADARALLEDSERRALRAVRRIVVTSRATASRLAAFGVVASSIAVVEPGTEPAPQSRGSHNDGSGSDTVQLLCVATVVPRKGHDVLIRALASLPGERWHLTCVGGLDRDVTWAASVRELVRASGLDARVSFAGELGREALDARYDSSDVFVLPTWYEGYGMAVAEALARGLPVVSSATGAIGELVTPEAGVLVPPGDVSALAGALRSVIADAELRSSLGRGARGVRLRLPSWDDAAASMARTIEGVDG
jgi:glycosyltransferase involved in cell wall biosynthesis